MTELADIDRKIRLAKRNLDKPDGKQTPHERVLDILGDIQEILERQDEAIRAMPRSS